MKTKRLVGHCLLVSLLACLAPAQQTSPNTGAAVEEFFLTGAVETPTGNGQEKRWVPDDTKLAFAWSDRPFAVHVPFTMETETRLLTQYAVPRPGDPKTPVVYAKDYDVRVYFRGFAYTNSGEVRACQPSLHTAGLYRFDGLPVYREGPSNRLFFLERLPIPNRQAFPNSTPYPYGLNGRPAAAVGRVGFFLVLDPREAPPLRTRESPLGSGMDTDEWKFLGERTVGKLVVALSQRGQPATEREFEIPIRQNGWIVRESKVNVSGNWERTWKVTSGVAEEWYFRDLGNEAKGATVTTRHRVTTGNPYDRNSYKQTEVEWTLQMPSRVFDHLGAEGSLRVKQTSGGAFPQGAKYGLQLYGNGGAASFKAHRFSGPTNATAAAGDAALREVDLFPYRELGHFNTMDDRARSKDANTGLHADAWRVDIRPTQRGGFTVGGDASNILPWNWPPAQDAGRHRLFTASVNYYAGDTPDKPSKLIEFFASRLSDVENNRVGRTGVDQPAIPLTRSKDPYLPWFLKYSEFLEKQEDLMKENKTAMATRGADLNASRHSAKILRRAVDAARDPVAGASASVSEEQYTRLLARLREKSQEIRTDIEEIERLGAQSEQALKDILAEIKRADGLFHDRHPEIEGWLIPFQERLERLPLEIAATTGDYQKFENALDKLRIESRLPGVQVARAQMLIERDRTMDALFAVRDALGLEPNHPDARRMLSELEAAWIKSAMAKSHGAIGEARGAFYRYLGERGFGPNDPKLNWLGQLWAPLRHLNTETLWVAFTSGGTYLLSKAMSGVDKASEEERAMSAYVDSMTRAYLGLQTMLRLCIKGYSLGEITSMKTSDLATLFPDPAHARELGLCIQEAIKNLPDVRALVSDDRVNFRAAVEHGYWNEADVGHTWAEWIGDISSPKNVLFLLLPSSTVTVGGRMVNASTMGARGAAGARTALVTARGAAQAAPKIISGTEYLGSFIGWNSAVQKVGSWRSGKAFLKFLETLDREEKLLDPLEKVVWHTTKMLAIMTVLGTSLHTVEEVAGPRAVILAEAFLVFATDGALLRKMLRIGGMKPPVVRALIAERFIPTAQAHQARIAGKLKEKAQLRLIVAKRRANIALSGEEQALLAAGAAPKLLPMHTPDAPPSHPTGNAATDQEILLESAKKTAGPDPDAAEEILTTVDAMEERIAKRRAEVQRQIEDAEKLLKELDEAERIKTPGPVPTGESVGEPLPAWFQHGADHPSPLSHKSRIPEVQKADEALFNGKTEEALLLYEEVMATITAGGDEALMLERRLQFARQLLLTPKMPRGKITVSDEIPPELAELILGREAVWRGRRVPDSEQGSHTISYDCGEFRIKELETGLSPNGQAMIQPDHLRRAAEAELVAAALARELGLPVPGIAVRYVHDAAGRVQKLQILYRTVRGQSVKRLTPEAVFHLREQLSQFEALANWINDFDRHAGNYMIQDGVVVGIDWGLADPRGHRVGGFKPGATGPSEPANIPNVLEGPIVDGHGRDHWIRRVRQKEVGRGNSPPGIAGVNRLIAQECLSHKAAQPMLAKIDQLLADPARLRALLDRVYRQVSPIPNRPGIPQAQLDHMEKVYQAAVDEAMANLSWRRKHLDKLLDGLDTRRYESMSILPPRKSGASLRPEFWKRPRFGARAYKPAAVSDPAAFPALAA